MDSNISIIEPAITGNKIKSKETSANMAINGLAAAGGCIILKYIIRATDKAADKPKEKN